ncbi:hypothetical protein ACFORL_12710 [Legionella dresdenensis]|uniref:Uncharacterized protein n=1 Tax=Legionella dresdenensis TaxID=450200 RepID=A0ABV8CIN9_9GAMM
MPLDFFGTKLPLEHNPNAALLKQATNFKLKSEARSNEDVYQAYQILLGELKLNDDDFQFKCDQHIFGYLVITMTIKDFEGEESKIRYPMNFMQIAKQCNSSASPLSTNQHAILPALLRNAGGLILNKKLPFDPTWIDSLALSQQSRLLLKSRWERYQQFEVEYVLTAEPQEDALSVNERECCHCFIM